MPVLNKRFDLENDAISVSCTIRPKFFDRHIMTVSSPKMQCSFDLKTAEKLTEAFDNFDYRNAITISHAINLLTQNDS